MIDLSIEEYTTPKSILMDVLDENPKIEIQRKIDFLRKQYVSPEVLNYLKEILINLEIEIYRKPAEKIMDLMAKEKLEGFCWETTESAICFFDNTAIINRGILTYYNYEKYEHAWIYFKFNNEEYAFDPCFAILSKNNLYMNTFDAKVMGTVSSEKVKKYLIECCLKKQKQLIEEKTLEESMSKRYERQKKETRFEWKENINSPMYRNSSGYIADIEEGQIRKLFVHYY